MGEEEIADWKSVLIAVCAIVFTFVYRKINSASVVLGGALLGYALTFFKKNTAYVFRE